MRVSCSNAAGSALGGEGGSGRCGLSRHPCRVRRALDSLAPWVGLLFLRLLKDDIALFPAYQGAPLMKAEFAEKNPQIVTALNRLAGKISEEEMSEMNYRVKVQGESAENVARDYLEKNGLLGK